MDVSAVQYVNALSPIFVTLPGMVKEVNEEHCQNERVPMEVTLLPKLNEVMLGQPSNALSPIVVTLSGMVREASDAEWKKLEFSKVRTLLGILTVPALPDGLWIRVVMPLLKRTPSTLA